MLILTDTLAAALNTAFAINNKRLKGNGLVAYHPLFSDERVADYPPGHILYRSKTPEEEEMRFEDPKANVTVLEGSACCLRCQALKKTDCVVHTAGYAALEPWANKIRYGGLRTRRPPNSTCKRCKRAGAEFCHFEATARILGPGFLHQDAKDPNVIFPIPTKQKEREPKVKTPVAAVPVHVSATKDNTIPEPVPQAATPSNIPAGNVEEINKDDNGVAAKDKLKPASTTGGGALAGPVPQRKPTTKTYIPTDPELLARIDLAFRGITYAFRSLEGGVRHVYGDVVKHFLQQQ